MVTQSPQPRRLITSRQSPKEAARLGRPPKTGLPNYLRDANEQTYTDDELDEIISDTIKLLQDQEDPTQINSAESYSRNPALLPPRWTPLKPHAKQHEALTSPARFVVIPAGRRSGKTEIAKRKVVAAAVLPCLQWTDPWYVVAAPTLPQARRIYWRDLKAMINPLWLARKPMESELTIQLITGAEITVMGMDTPERIEGRPLNGVVLDEYANMKAHVWTAHVRPSLSDRLGWAWFIGVPEGRNHYYKLYQRAISGTRKDWAGFTWFSSTVLPESEVESAREDLDPLTFRQEYEAAFVTFEGRTYYPFDSEIHAAEDLGLYYDPDLPLLLCFDFNVAPGVAVIMQEHIYNGLHPQVARPMQGNGKLMHLPTKDYLDNRHAFPASFNPPFVTMALGEVYIPRNSNTERVCEEILGVWGNHRGRVHLYGDATGGAKGTAKVKGSDWALVKTALESVFKGRLVDRVRKSNPKERERINAVNSRLINCNGQIRFLLDRKRTPHLQEDFEGVKYKDNGSGEIDKDATPELTHISDAAGYCIEREHPVGARSITSQQEV